MTSIKYKYKPDKHNYRVGVKTIGEIHDMQTNKFKKNQRDIPNKYKKLNKLKKKLKKCINDTKNTPVNLNVDELRKINKIKKKISELEEDIDKCKNCTDEIDYFSKTKDIIYDYYNLTNGKLYNIEYIKDANNDDNSNQFNNILSNNTNTNTKTNTDNDNNNNNINNNVAPDNANSDTNNNNVNRVQISQTLLNINNNIKKKRIKKPVKRRNKQKIRTQKSIMSLLLGSDDESEKVNNEPCKASLQDEYLKIMDKDYACSKSKIDVIKKCPSCNTTMIIEFTEAILLCPNCGEIDDIIIESEVPSNLETFNEKPKYPYKRRGHCIEKLNQFLCKGTQNVPNVVFTIINNEIIKYGLVKKNISLSFVEKMLKKHGLSKYYEQSIYIYNKITGTKPMTITREQYETVLSMFDKANEAYTKYKPPDRDNFLKYTFVLNKIFLTIGLKTHAKYFKLLKSDSKTNQQEKIWKQICNDIGWTVHHKWS